jgi:hypothetical protein
MVSIKGRHPGLNDYIQHVVQNSQSIDDLPAEVAARSWRDFLRNAYLYYRPSRSIAYTIDPFAEDGFDNIAQRLREQTINALPFSDPSVLGLNLASLLELEAPENTRLWFKMSTYSIETDYGYWVPEAYVGYIERKFRGVIRPQAACFGKARAGASKSRREVRQRAIQIYLDAGEQGIGSGNRPLRLSANQKEAIRQKILRRFRHLTNLQTHQKALERLSQAWFGAPVPEFWEDEASVARFFDGSE